MTDRRLAVIDLGSNSFRLVVFTWGEHGGHGWWRRTDEIHEAVRVGEGLDASGALQPEPMERALETIELFAHFCRATGIDDVRPVATSAIRDATNQQEFLKAGARALGARRRGALARGRGALRLPRRGQLDDAVRRRRARPRRRLDAAHVRRRPRGARHALVAAGRRAHDRALPGRRQRQAQAAQGAARSPGRRARRRRLAARCGPRRRAPGRHRRHGPQPRGRGGARGRAALIRRPGLRARPARRSTTSSSASRR